MAGHPQYGAPPQVVVVKQGGGMMKGCLIAFGIIALLGLLMGGACAGMLYYGVSQAKLRVDEAKSVCNEFMAHLSKGDTKAAHALCDPSSIKLEELEGYYAANESKLKGNTGLTYIELMGITGNYNNSNGTEEWSISDVAVVGTNASVSFQLRKTPSDARFKVTYFKTGGPAPKGDLNTNKEPEGN